VKVPLFTVLLAALNVTFAWAVGAQLIGTPSLREQVKAAAATATQPAVPKVPAPLAPTSFDGLQAQAVFHKSRSFYVAPASPSLQQPAPDYRMVGLMAMPKRPPSAVLLHNQSNVRVRVAAGDQLDGWSVAEVNAKRVVVQLGERTAEINSATRVLTGGIVVTSSNQPSSTSASPGMVRVLGTPSVAPSAPPAPPPANVTVDAATRLYRPPTQ
jgi:hypothetical protein